MTTPLSAGLQQRERGVFFFPRILAIDPGNEASGICGWDHGKVTLLGKMPNTSVRRICRDADKKPITALIVEDVRHYAGVRPGKNAAIFGLSLIRTCQWIGRFVEAWGQHQHFLITRKEVVTALCGVSTAGDPQVRQRVIDELGEPPTKARPNACYPTRPAGDEWSAIAIVLAFHALAREGRDAGLERLQW